MPRVLPDGLCLALADLADQRGLRVLTAMAASATHDELAERMLFDAIEDGELPLDGIGGKPTMESSPMALTVLPFEIGKSYLFCSVTLYYVGRVAAVSMGWIVLEDASWVHWTGRLSTLIRTQSFTHPSHASRQPRVEPCGTVILSSFSLVVVYPFLGELPTEPTEIAS